MSEEEIKKPLTKEDLRLIRELVYAEFDISFQNIAKKLLNEVDLKETQLQQKENIIKEVREYIASHKLYCFKYDDEELFEITTDKKAKDDLLNILKGDDKK